VDAVSILDWGGSLGHHHLARAMYPDLRLDYHVSEVRSFCEDGRTLLPAVQFHTDSWIERQYDLVMASGSLQYSSDWKSQLDGLARAARDYLFVTRLPTVAHTSSYRTIQRAHRYGYQTEFVGMVLDQEEFVQRVRGLGFELVREFLLLERPHIYGAPEQAKWKGFLFRRQSPVA
jgi:putative methyltransferase (TIGR04325 family)